jgi:hypothetical protein
MSHAIWKYPLYSNGCISIPRDARVVHVGWNPEPSGHSNFCVWAIVDPNQPPEGREFLVVATGEWLPSGRVVKHLATLVNDAHEVYHVFEILRPMDALGEAIGL